MLQRRFADSDDRFRRFLHGPNQQFFHLPALPRLIRSSPEMRWMRTAFPSPERSTWGYMLRRLGSVPTAQVRTFSALLQGPRPFDTEGRDPWWTLMVFYNSLRELGTGLSLLQTDIPEHLRSIANRCGLSFKDLR